MDKFIMGSYSISTKPISGICKQPALWGHEKNRASMVPLIYLQKPKWISEETFLRIVESIRLDIPRDIEL